MVAEVNSEGKALDTKSNVLLDGGIDAMASSDVEVFEVILVGFIVG